MPTQNDDVQVHLSHDEALILLDRLSKIDDPNLDPRPAEVEQQILWKIEGQLEGVLREVVAPDYQEQVDLAKRRVLSEQA